MVASEATLVLECVECGKKSEGSAGGWRGLLTNGELEPPGSRDVLPRLRQKDFDD
jgi:hypothetical protein